MNKKQTEITDKLNDCLNAMVFDGTIDMTEKIELSRKLGVLFELPDLLPYFDLRDIAISALESGALIKPMEEPVKRYKIPVIKPHNGSLAPNTHGEHDVKGVDTGSEAGNVPAQVNGGEGHF